MNVKRIIKWAIPLFVTVWFPFMFYMGIRNYHAHADDPFTIMFGIPCAICCITGCFLALKRKESGLAVVCGLAAVSCIFFCYWISRIPFCAMCEPIHKHDLGFMLEPFADRFSDFYLE